MQPNYPSIEDYGLIGNCSTAALVSSRGSMDWLCMPHFDSPSVFARILDIERGGAWSIGPTDTFKANHSYLENTNVLETIFTCDTGRARLLDFMPTFGVSDQPVSQPLAAVARIIEGMDGDIEIESVCVPRPDYARAMPNFTVEDQRITFDGFTLAGDGKWQIDERGTSVSCRLTVHAGERSAFVLQHKDGHTSGRGSDPFDWLEETIGFWRSWTSHCTYRGPYLDAVVRSALTLKLLTFAPTGAIVAAPTTSLPEEIGGERNWDYRFTWIRDAAFTLHALLRAGFVEEDEAFFEWIMRTVELEETGTKILYPVSAEGEVTERTLDHLEGYRSSKPVRIGNAAASQRQLDVFGEALDSLHFAWRTGGYNPERAWSHFQPLVDWVSNNWRLPGHGIWEVRGGMRQFVYSKVMSWVALDRGIKLAEANGLAGDTERWREERDLIRAEVFDKGWSEDLGAFKQSFEDDRLDAANLMMSLVGFIEGDDPRMVGTIDATLDQLVVDGLCYRYLGAPEGLSGDESTFVLCTFWLVDALILAGRAKEAKDLFEQMLSRATSLGLFAEEIDAGTGNQLGNFPQALSHIGVISAAVSLAEAGEAGSIEPGDAPPPTAATPSHQKSTAG